MPPHIKLQDDLKRRLNVSKVHETFSGGQKYVFIATCDGEKCAIKQFKSGFGEREQRELSFYQENEALPGIPKILNVIEHDSETIVIEEFIQGKCLNDISHQYSQNCKLIKPLIKNICSIMRPIWLSRKTHRDLKPENIIIKKDQTPVIIDFGILKDDDLSTITDTGFQPNTWRYAAPEQIMGKKESISYRTDFFSIGIIAYSLYYGKLPFAQTKEKLTQKIERGLLEYTTSSNCELNLFFNAIFKMDVSERPRNIKILLETL